MPKFEPSPNPVTIKKDVLIEKEPEEPAVTIIDEKPQVILIGEAFGTYIVAQKEESVFLIDKHAAHERILFNQLKAAHHIEVQALLTPNVITLNKDDYSIMLENTELLLNCGFEVEDFGNSSIAIRALPTTLVGEDLTLLISEIAGNLRKNGNVEVEAQEDLFHTVACKAAIKAGTKISALEQQRLAEKVLGNKDILYCPHGRPVAFEIKKRELEKMFGRIQ